MSLTAVYTDFIDSKTQAPKIVELSVEYPIETAEAYLTAAPFFKTASQIKWELGLCLKNAVQEIENVILKRSVKENEVITIIFNLKAEMVTEIIIHNDNENSNSKYNASDRIQAYMKTLFDSFFAAVPKEHVEELEFAAC